MGTVLRIVIFAVALAAVVLLGAWLAKNGGAVTFEWGPYRAQTTVARLALLAAVAGFALLMVVGLLNLVLRGPARLRGALRQSRREKGYERLTRGLVAVAAGDAREALRHARKADTLLGHPPLSLLLSAQAAQLEGDRATAQRLFTEMLEAPETEFLGLRGLMVEALRRGDETAAIGFARRARALRPDAAWAADALFGLQCRAGDWAAAQATLESARERRAVDAAGLKRRRGVVLTERARVALGEMRRDEALRLAREAHGEAPGLAAATSLLASLLIEQEQMKPAKTTIEKSWAATPHPELAELYRRACRANGLALYKAMGRLVELAPQAVESHLAAARVALDAGLTGEARRHMDATAGARLTTRIARLWAELEEATGHADKAQDWMRQAVDADPEAVWFCGSCQHAAPEWQALCGHCGAFDTIGWGHPGRDGLEPGHRPLPAFGAALLAAP